jgi:hypothetical protein
MDKILRGFGNAIIVTREGTNRHWPAMATKIVSGRQNPKQYGSREKTQPQNVAPDLTGTTTAAS